MTGDVRIFPPFRLDSDNARLWRGTEEIRVRRKTFDVLCYMVQRPGQLVTKAALLDAVWPDVSVSDSMPAISVRELRKALGDAVKAPRFIETVQGRGYRFIADVELEAVRVTVPQTARQASLVAHPHQSSYVGRERERSELRGVLSDASSGRGRLCLISGEPGIGKTRLCAEIALEAGKNRFEVLTGHCSEQEAVPYLPFVEVLESCFDRVQDPDSLRKLLGDDGPELARFLPKLRRIIPDLPAALELAPEQARRQLFNSFGNFIARLSRQQRTLLVLEDLHWADDSTLALFDHLSQRLADLPLLAIATHRESEIEVSPNLSRTLEDLVRGRFAIQIRLKGLPSNEVAQMLKTLSGQTPPATVASEIHHETEGNPFFVEELFRHLTEENRLYDKTGQFRTELKIGELEVPSNVRLVVGRRLGRLGEPTRKILAVAAVIGRSFTFELLEAAISVKVDALLDCLDDAQSVGLIRPSTEYPEARFEFSHELIRQAILAQLSVARRRRLHLEVAEAIEQTYSSTMEDHYSALAYHYAQTASTSKAVKYFHLAGVQAAHRSAYAEATRQLSCGLDLLSSLPDTSERDQQELALQTELGALLIGTKGDAAPEVKTALGRAVELSHRVGETPQLFGALFGLALFYMNRGQHRIAQGVAKDLLKLAQRADDPAPILVGHAVVGATSFWLGELAFAHANFEQGVALYDPERHRKLAFIYGLDPAAGALGYDGYTLWHLGYPDQAVRKAERGLALVQEAAHPTSLGMAPNHLAAVLISRREPNLALAQAEAAMALATEHGLPLWAGIASVAIGAAMVQLDQHAAAIVRLKEALKVVEATGSRVSPLYVTALAKAYAATGRVEEGVSLVEQALATSHELSAHINEPELQGLKGEILLVQASTKDAEEAERCFRTAIELAQRIGSKSIELRATTSLARLHLKKGKRDEARAMLADIYNWFTEGFDTADLKDAKALLDDLSP